MFYAKNSRRNRDPHAPVIVRNGLGFVSGQLPIEARALKYVGRVGVELTLDDARTYARGGEINTTPTVTKESLGFSWVNRRTRCDRLHDLMQS